MNKEELEKLAREYIQAMILKYPKTYKPDFAEGVEFAYNLLFCHSVEVGAFSKNEVLFREVLPVPTLQDICDKAEAHSEGMDAEYKENAEHDYIAGYKQALKDMGYGE
jgi:hypothetical protein